MGKELPNKIDAFAQFDGGISDYDKNAQDNEFAFGRSINYRDNPKQLKILPRTVNESGSVVTDFIKSGDVIPRNLDLYTYGDTGNFYKRTVSGAWSFLHQFPASHGNGLAYYHEDDYVYASTDKTLGRYGQLSSSQTIVTSGLSAYRGFSASGLEFGNKVPGALNVDYFSSSQDTYNYFASKGMTVVRIPFNWERLQTDLNGSLNTTYKGYIDDQITKAGNAGLKVILDCHNYGRRKIYKDGGITENFTDGGPALLYPWADYSANGSIVLRDWGTSDFGTLNNPVSANGYRVSFNMKFESQDSSFGVEGLTVQFMYADASNYYQFEMNKANNTWELIKRVAGSNTSLANGSFTWGTSATYAIVIDCNQATNGKINISKDGTPFFTTDSVSSDAGVAQGKITFYAPGVHVRLSSLVLNVDGDTSSGGIQNLTIGDGTLTTAHLADLWDRISTAYAANTTVLGYDIMNEPHDMPVPTTSSNYATTSTTTLLNQAAIDAIRANDTTHYIFCELDSWAGGQSFESQYGSNPTPWLTDSSNKLLYSFHYYFDNDHSGSYPIDFASTNNTRISSELLPLFQWAQNHDVMLFCGEYGVPNISDWQVCLTTFLTLCNTYEVWATHWAGGDAYTSPTTLQPTGTAPSYTDRLQMAVVGDSQYLQRNSTSTTTSVSFDDDFLSAQGDVPQNTHGLALVAASSHYADAADSASLSLTSDLTLEAEVSLNSLPSLGNSMAIMGKWDASGATKSYLYDIYAISSVFGTGSDGALTISSNTTQSLTDSACTGSAGSTNLTATNASFAAGQRVLIIQMQGTNAGQYETNTIVSYTTSTIGQTTVGTITLQTALEGSYSGKAQVLVMPQYSSVTVNTGFTWSAKAWNGTVGGILAFLCSGTITVNGTISGSELGFRGGAGHIGTGTPGEYGEGNLGPAATASNANPNGTGGGAGYVASGGLDGPAAGGGNATVGTAASGNVQGWQSIGGQVYGTADLSTLLPGGGGGGGVSSNGSQPTNGANGSKGGAVLFMTGVSITGTGSILSNGGNTVGTYGQSGAGAGGDILLRFQTATFDNLTIQAQGGTGSTAGGLGRIAINYLSSYTGTSSPTFNVVQDATLVSTTTYQFRLGVSSDGNNSEFLTCNIPVITTGQYNRLAVTWAASSSLAKFYMGGQLVGTAQGSITSIHNNASLLYIGANKGASAVQNFLDGYIDDVRVWSGVRTQEQLTASAFRQLSGSEAGLKGYWKLNNAATDASGNSNTLTLRNSAAYTTYVPFSDPTTRLDIDQSLTGSGQVYSATTAINEGATHRQTFVPSKDPQKSIMFNVNAKGTGNVTVVIHDNLNRPVATITILAANMHDGEFEFVFDEPWRPVRGASYHAHIYSSVADLDIVTTVASDMETAIFKTYYQFLVETNDHPLAQVLNKLAIGNERYLATYAADEGFNPHRLVLQSGWKIRCMTLHKGLLAIGCVKGSEIDDTDQGMIFWWDGYATTYIDYTPVPEGGVNAMLSSRGILYVWAGYHGDMLEYRGGDSAEFVKRVPKMVSEKYIETLPNAVTMWDGLIRWGVAGPSDSEAVERGVYTWGRRKSSNPESLSYDFPISTGNRATSNVQVGFLCPIKRKLLIAWKDGVNNGVDVVDPAGNCFPSATIEKDIKDYGAVWKEKQAVLVRADYETLDSGHSVQLKYRLNRADNWTYGSVHASTDTDPTKARLEIPFGNNKEVEFGADIFSSDGTSPTILEVTLETNPKSTERIV